MRSAGAQPIPSKKLVVPDSFSGRLLMLLNERGGDVFGHRALGRALGCSRAHVGNVLRELANAGSVTVQATKMGTVRSLHKSISNQPGENFSTRMIRLVTVTFGYSTLPHR